MLVILVSESKLISLIAGQRKCLQSHSELSHCRILALFKEAEELTLQLSARWSLSWHHILIVSWDRAGLASNYSPVISVYKWKLHMN